MRSLTHPMYVRPLVNRNPRSGSPPTSGGGTRSCRGWSRAGASAIACALVVTLVGAPAGAGAGPKTEDQKTLYALGLLVSRSVAASA